MTTTNKITIVLRLEKGDLELIDKAAYMERRSRNAQIMKFIEEGFKNYGFNK